MNSRSKIAPHWVVVASIGASGCLPKDTRPPPGSVLVTASADDALLQGIPGSATADGWSISYDRVLLDIGRVNLDGDQCSTYSEAHYDRVLDMLAGVPQKVSESFALGQCDFGYGVANPADDSLLGDGVSHDDIVFLRTAGSDKYAGASGISVAVQGHAAKGSLTKAFSWAFRQENRYRECNDGSAPTPVRGLHLAESVASTVDLLVRGEALFEDNLDASIAKLRFAPFADADTTTGNDDGEVTLDELANVSIESLASTTSYRVTKGSTAARNTLEDYLYLDAFPALVRFGPTGACTQSTGKRD